MFDAHFLYASLLWGTIGSGCLMYGYKQCATPPLVAGLGLLAASFIPSALLMSVLSLLLLAGMAWGIKQGY